MAHRVVIDCDSRRMSAYTPIGIHVTFQGGSMKLYPRQCMTPDRVDS